MKYKVGDKESSLGLWVDSLERYKKIYNITTELRYGLTSDGNDELNIKPCPFCEKYDEDDCDSCEWGKVFGKCEEGNSEWAKINDVAVNLRNLVLDSVNKIQKQIDKLT